MIVRKQRKDVGSRSDVVSEKFCSLRVTRETKLRGRLSDYEGKLFIT